jgi:hypothetical protein
MNNLNTNDGSQYNAGGREKELVGYHSKIRKYQNDAVFDRIRDILTENADRFSGKVFRVDRDYDKPEKNADPFTDFIFFDEQSLKNVQPKKFLKTFAENQVDFSEFKKILDDLKEVVYYDFRDIYNTNHTNYSSDNSLLVLKDFSEITF